MRNHYGYKKCIINIEFVNWRKMCVCVRVVKEMDLRPICEKQRGFNPHQTHFFQLVIGTIAEVFYPCNKKTSSVIRAYNYNWLNIMLLSASNMFTATAVPPSTPVSPPNRSNVLIFVIVLLLFAGLAVRVYWV